jgi:hypothetical protein
MVSREVAEAVISIISCESETLSKLAAEFASRYSRIDQLSVLTSLAALIMDDVLDLQQQIVTVWLLRAAFPGIPIKENPFYGVFQFILQSGASSGTSYSQKLCDIVSCFVSSVDVEDFKDHSVHKILDNSFTFDSAPSSDLSNLNFPSMPRISPIIISKADPTATSQISQHQLLTQFLMDAGLWTAFEIPFSRQPAEICIPNNEELQFIHIASVDAPPYLFDQGTSMNAQEATKFFVAESSERTLKPAELSFVLDELKKSASIAKDISSISKGISDKMVEFNPAVAAFFICEFAKTEPLILRNFVKGDISMASVEVVKQILVNSTPPSGFLPEYVANCIEILQSTKDQAVLRSKAHLFCGLMVELREKGFEFDGRVFLDLHSLEIELTERGIAEASVLSDLVQ